MGTDGDRTLWPGRWFRVTVTLPRDLEDDAIGLLQLYGCEGSDVRPAGPRRLAIEAWFTTDDDARAAAAKLGALPDVKLAGPPEPVEDTGWLAAALAPRGPLAAGRFVVVDRREDAAVATGRLAIFLPPGRAFGTGEHATTRMCLTWLDRLLVPGEAVFDLGTGSGILAIAAVLAGAGPVTALDIDPHVIDVARENLDLNGVTDRVALGQGSWNAVAEDARFGLIVANIHRTALVKAAPQLASRLVPGGRLIASGFGPDAAHHVLAAYTRQGLVPDGELVEGEWTALAFRTA